MWKPDYVLFDCDGVLVDSETLTQILLSRELSRYGLNIAPDKMGEMFVGGTMAGVMQTAKDMGADLPDDWLDYIYATLFAELAKQCEIIPGVHQMLDALDAAGVGFATCSNGPMSKMDVTLRRTGLWDRFEGRIFSAHDCAAAKPAPDVYLKAAVFAGVDPAQCAVVEDSATGAKAGRAAGMRCFGYAAQTNPSKLTPICHEVFTDMLALPEVLRLA
ncbi:MAG: HAD family phosphatase [Sulfitobacter sp.]